MSRTGPRSETAFDYGLGPRQPIDEELWREPMLWSGRLALITVACAAPCVVGGAIAFHDRLTHRRAVGMATAATAVGVAALVVALITRGRPASGDVLWPARARVTVFGAYGLLCAALPWVVRGPGNTVYGSTLAFPLSALALAVVVFAPVQRWFRLFVAGVGGPTALWAVIHGTALAYHAVGTAVVILTAVLLHREIHRLVLRTLTARLRHQALLEAVERDRVRIEQANAMLEQANDRLGHQATHDSLTGVLNRRGLEQRLARFLSESRVAQRHVTVLFCDLDRFKMVNDSLGHAAGDRILVLTAERIAAALPDGALLARLGGDEFVAVVAFHRAEPDPSAAGVALADSVRTGVGSPMTFEDREFVVTTTIGVALVPATGGFDLDILRHADRALHYAKSAGRDRAELFGEHAMSRSSPSLDDEHQVRQAIERGDIVPWYQPIVDGRDGRVVGAEMLARWVAPDGRVLRAAEFIDAAGDSGMLERLSEVVIARGVADVTGWDRAGLPPGFRVSVNLPPRFVSRTSRNERLIVLLAAAPHRRIIAEVSERSVLDDLELAAERLAELRALGLQVSIDDFGVANASLALLRRMPLDGAKLDRSFVAGLADDVRDQALAAGLIRLTTELGLTVIAEGVEDERQAATLRRFGCHLHQGYLYGEAVAAADFAARIGVGPETTLAATCPSLPQPLPAAGCRQARVLPNQLA